MPETYAVVIRSGVSWIMGVVLAESARDAADEVRRDLSGRQAEAVESVHVMAVRDMVEVA